MKRFKLGQRVNVGFVEVGLQLVALGATGSVVRLRMSDDGAWVELDQRSALEMVHPFPADDRRGTHVLAYPDHCKPEKQPASAGHHQNEDK